MSTGHHTHETQHGHHEHRAAGTHAHKPAGAEGPAKSEIPVLNVSKLFERFRLPGIDLPALAEAQRKNIEALQEANQKVYRGAIALVQRQAEIFEETMSQWQAAAKELSAKNPVESMTKQADLARKAMENAFGHMRELAEMAAKSQAEAYEIIGKRVRAGIEEFREYYRRTE
jgi:phasin family protein